MIVLDLRVKLDLFEGPLDLLLHLIEKSEVDIYEVPIAQITDQYMSILSDAKKWELNVASEFLVMAATLISIKSRMLLPRPEKAIDQEGNRAQEDWFDPREQLVERLLSYKRYKRLGEMLRKREQERSKLYCRPALDLTPYTKPHNPVAGLTADDLLEAFVSLLKKEPEKEPVATVVREEISVSDRMEEIMGLLEENDAIGFYTLVPRTVQSKEQIITTFLALLELMKLRRIFCVQQEVFTEILIKKIEPEVVVCESSS